jgi:hypothetical protein
MSKVSTDRPPASRVSSSGVLFGHYHNVASVVVDLEAYFEFARSNPDEYVLDEVTYQEVVTTVINNLTVIPVEREFIDEEPSEDSDAVLHHIDEITRLLSFYFRKPQSTVKDYLMDQMKDFPVDEVREAYALKRTNRLH